MRLKHLFVSILGFFATFHNPAHCQSSLLFENALWRAEKIMSSVPTWIDQTMNLSRDEDVFLPKTLPEALNLMKSTCHAKNEIRTVSQKLVLESTEQLVLTCGSRLEKQIYRFVLTLSQNGNYLEDLQVIEVNERLEPNQKDAKFELKPAPGGEMIIAVGLSTLASGLLARAAFPGEKDKLKHAVIGNLISLAGALVGYYGFDLSKEKSTLLGIGLTVVVAVLKEYYDSRHRDRHSVELRDVGATVAGGIVGVIGFRIQIRF